MGGCLASLLSAKNSFTVVPHEEIIKFKAQKDLSIKVSDDKSGESGIYRAAETRDMSLNEMFNYFYFTEDVSLVNKFKKKCLEYDKKKAMGVRPLVKIEKSEIIDSNGKKKPWEYIHLGPTKYYTYRELWGMITSFGMGLIDIGLKPGMNVAIYEDTRMEWMVSCYGIWSQSMIGVTVYANLGEDALKYALNETNIDAIILNGNGVNNIIKDQNEGVRPIMIVIDDIPAGVDTSNYTVHSWKSIIERGEKLKEEGKYTENFPQDPDSLALIMYTSGTTGDPKGVIMTHGNVVAAIVGFDYKLLTYVEGVDVEQYVYLAYLPCAHILEFVAENVILLRGSFLGYGTPRTLTNTSARPHGDLEEFRPFFFVGVPRIFDTIKKAVEAKIQPGIKRKIFERAYADRLEGYKNGKDWPGWNDTAFAAPRAMLGGRCRVMISGGAPLSAKTQEFLTVLFGTCLIQGYGLTETCANFSIQNLWDTTTECIGPLLRSLEFKLVDYDKWKSSDPEPKGEIWMRGPVVAKGYYKQPEKTKESFTEDGWFKSGDIGQVMPNGCVKIIGRIKNIAKNSNGEYIAFEALEVIYVLNELCMPNGVCVLVDPHKPYICAIVCTDEAKAMKFAKENGIEGEWPSILDKPEFNEKAALSLAETAKNNNRSRFELVKYVHVTKDEWTPENGLLTASSKIRRINFDKYYKNIIEGLFSHPS